MNPATLPVMRASAAPAAPRMPERSADGAAQDASAAAAAAAATMAAATRHWSLQARCSLTPRQFGLCFAALALVSALVAALFWLLGARYVAFFSGLELLLLGVAFGWHACHAADGEQLSLRGSRLHVEHRAGLRHWRSALDLNGLRVAETDDGRIELCSYGHALRVGGRLAAPRRRQLAAELRRLALN